ncbi:outer membrane beta-barrel protein [Helicobacter heilmannii]|nr:outer membrane beta-barrel protein [Helicobacter heilmannii]
MNFLVGYQHFFSQHLGFSLDAFLGYGYIRSPIYSRLSFFKNLQDIQIDVGGNLIYDFNVPKNYQSPLFYGMFAGVQGGSTNFVLGAGDKSLWRASYNLDVDLGFRFQFSTNIIKWGVDIPLIPHELNWQVDSTHLQLDQNAKDIGIFMTYEKLIF